MVSHFSQVREASQFFFISSIVHIVHNLGPTIDSPDDQYVLVGAAHCNHICKDRLTGHVLETCCCRPPSDPGSCAQVRMITELSELFGPFVVISCG